MQTIAVHQESSALILGIPDFGGGLYAHDKGADHPTPPAPDRGDKPKPQPDPVPGKKK